MNGYSLQGNTLHSQCILEDGTYHPPLKSGPSSEVLQAFKSEFVVSGQEENLLPCEYPVHKTLTMEGDLPQDLLEEGFPGEIDPRGLHQTYHDVLLGTRLPKLAVINVRRKGQKIRVIQDFHKKPLTLCPEGHPTDLDNLPENLCQFLPSHDGQKKLKVLEKIHYGIGIFLTMTGIIGGIHWAENHLSNQSWLPTGIIFQPGIPPLGIVGTIGAILGLLLAATLYLLSGHILKRTLRETFNYTLQGYLPQGVRKFLRKKLQQYDDVYLICDAQGHWETEGTQYLSAKAAIDLDPLIVGEKKGRFYLLGWFDLTLSEVGLL